MSIKLIREADLGISGDEAVGLSLAIRAVGIATVAHVSLTQHIGVGDASTIVEVEVRPGVAILYPRLSRVEVVAIVVTEDIALIDPSVRTIEVILDTVMVAGEVSLGKLIHITGILSTHQVLDSLVLARVPVPVADATRDLEGRGDLLGEGRVERHLKEVIVSTLYHIHCGAVAGPIAQLIDLIETVPVDLRRATGLPEIAVVVLHIGRTGKV